MVLSSFRFTRRSNTSAKVQSHRSTTNTHRFICHLFSDHILSRSHHGGQRQFLVQCPTTRRAKCSVRYCGVDGQRRLGDVDYVIIHDCAADWTRQGKRKEMKCSENGVNCFQCWSRCRVGVSEGGKLRNLSPCSSVPTLPRRILRMTSFGVQ